MCSARRKTAINSTALPRIKGLAQFSSVGALPYISGQALYQVEPQRLYAEGVSGPLIYHQKKGAF